MAFASASINRPTRDAAAFLSGSHIANTASDERRLRQKRERGFHSFSSEDPLLTNAKISRHYWLLLAEGHLTRRLFGGMLRRIAMLPSPAE